MAVEGTCWWRTLVHPRAHLTGPRNVRATIYMEPIRDWATAGARELRQIADTRTRQSELVLSEILTEADEKYPM